jgi:hypothetical protein
MAPEQPVDLHLTIYPPMKGAFVSDVTRLHRLGDRERAATLPYIACDFLELNSHIST